MKKEVKKPKTFQYFFGAVFCFGLLIWLLWAEIESEFLWDFTIETVFVSLLLCIVIVFLFCSGIYLIVKVLDSWFEGDC